MYLGLHAGAITRHLAVVDTGIAGRFAGPGVRVSAACLHSLALMERRAFSPVALAAFAIDLRSCRGDAPTARGPARCSRQDLDEDSAVPGTGPSVHDARPVDSRWPDLRRVAQPAEHPLLRQSDPQSAAVRASAASQEALGTRDDERQHRRPSLSRLGRSSSSSRCAAFRARPRSRQGNRLGMIGMAIAIVTTLAVAGPAGRPA